MYIKPTKKLAAIILGLILLLSGSRAEGAGSTLSSRLKGQLLLQVQDKGRVWYIDTVGEKRHEVTFGNALHLFQRLALGISNNDLSQIPIHPDSVSESLDSDGDGFSDRSEVEHGYNPELASNPVERGNDRLKINSRLAERLKGKLLLQVENRGRIWYVDLTGRRHEVTWQNLMELFRRLALGISNSDLALIEQENSESESNEASELYNFNNDKEDGGITLSLDGFFRVPKDKSWAELKITLSTYNKAQTQQGFEKDFSLAAASGRIVPFVLVIKLNPQIAELKKGEALPPGLDYNQTVVDTLRDISPKFAEFYEWLLADEIPLEKLDFTYQIKFGNDIYRVYNYSFEGENLSEKITFYHLDSEPEIETKNY